MKNQKRHCPLENRLIVNKLGYISRRSFIKGSGAFAAGLALEHLGGDIFSATPANASESAETKIVIVRPTQIGIVAYDVTNASNPISLQGCKVKITSRYNNKVVEGTTNQDGKIVLDIKDLAEPIESTDDVIAFNGSIVVEKQGYRDVAIPLARISGHTAFIAPTRPLDDKPYFRTLTLNEWDVQYTKPTFITDSTNTESQKFSGQLVMPSETLRPSVKLIFDENGQEREIGDFKIASTQNNIANVEISGEFLNSNKDSCLKETLAPKVVFSTSSTNSEYETAINIDPKPAPVNKIKSDDKIIVPSAFGDSANVCELPNNFIKPFAGSKFSIWKPSIPLLLEVSPHGYFMIGLGYTSIRPKSDNGELLDLDSWKKAPSQSISDQIKKQFESQKKAIDSYNKQRACPNDPTKTKKVSHSCTSKFKIVINAQAFGMMKYDWKEKMWTGSFSGVFSCGFNATWTHQMSILVVPVFFQVSPSFTMQASLYLGATTKDINKLDFVGQNVSFGFGTNIAVALSVGVGIVGFASVSCTGAGYISYFVNFAPNKGKPIPHIIAGCGGSLSVTLQFTIFKYTFKVCGGDWPQLFDSNKDDNSLPSSNESSYEMPSFEELCQNATIVTNSEMLNSKEFSLSSNVLTDWPTTIEYEGDGDDGDFGETNPHDAIVIIPNEEETDFSNTDYIATYDYVGTMKSINLSNDEIGVEGISTNDLGGINPSFDKLLFENITSNPRLKILKTAYGRTAMFRIATVDVGGGNARSRIVYHLFENGNWTKPYVIEFDPQISGVDRANMFDVDFDVVEAAGYNGSNYIFLNVISGTYPNGDSTTFQEGIQARYASLISLYDSYFSDNPLRVDPQMTCNLVSLEADRTLICPSISAYSDELSVVGTKDFCVIASVVRKNVNSEAMKYETGMRRSFFARWEYDNDKDQEVFKINYTRGDNVYGAYTKLFPVQLDEEGYEPNVGTASKIRRSTCASVGSHKLEVYKYVGTYTDNLPWKKYYQSFLGEKIATSSSDYEVDKIYTFGAQQGLLLATCRIKDDNGEETSGIFRVDFDPKNSGNLTFTQISETSGCVSDLVCDPDGHYFFYAENIDGKTGQEYTPNEDGQVEGPSSDIESHRYYIKGVAYISGLFTRPFVFGELEHAADSLQAACINDDYISFMVDDITDIDNSLSNIYDVRIPFVKCLTPTALTSIDPFCFSGEPSTFAVQIRNDGNLVATGATFNFIEVQSGKTIDSKKVDFSKSSTSLSSTETTNSSYNTESWGAGSELLENPLVKNSGANVIIPGETKIYNIEFNIPEDWADEKQVRVTISNIEYLTPSSINNYGDSEDITISSYHVDSSKNPTETINVTNEAELDELNIASGEVKERCKQDNNNEDPLYASSLAKTGDNAKGQLAIAAAGAIASGFAAYSARRNLNENTKNSKPQN